MGKITDALRKATEEKLLRIEKITKIKESQAVVAKKVGQSKVDPSIVAYFDPKALITEQYKILRTNLLSMNKGKPPRAIVMTSAIHGEGKTITSLNLAVSLSQAVNKPKVLLVDADLRRGRMAKCLGVKSDVGLTEVLSGSAKVEDVMFSIDLENLTVISSGSVPHNPAELLASDNMKSFLNFVRDHFDHILIDAPPIIPVTDSGIVGAQVDGAIMVIQAGRTQRGIVHRAEELLEQSHTNIIGHVLTNIEYHLPEYIYRYL